MFLTLFASARKLFRPPARQGVDDLLSPEQTRKVLARERARADRTADRFAVVAFAPQGAGLRPEGWGALVKVLKARLRFTDEGPDRALRVREDGVLLETLPRPDGRFDIVLTVLNNPSFPLIRYALGDSTDRPLEKPARGFATLGGVVGRHNDLILARSGRHPHPILFDELFSRDPAIRSWQVHQRQDGSLSVTLELKGPGAALDTAALARKVSEQAEGQPVAVQVVASLPRVGQSKHRWVRSDLAVR
jgi:hypothetical protein